MSGHTRNHVVKKRISKEYNWQFHRSFDSREEARRIAKYMTETQGREAKCVTRIQWEETDKKQKASQ